MTKKARVIRVLDNTEHKVLDTGSMPGQARLVGAPYSLEIQESEGGVFLLYLSQTGDCIADTWHQTIGDAMAQAEFEFGIDENDWVEASAVGWGER